MHGTTKALIVAAAALQAGANPIRLLERQVSSTALTSLPLASATSSFAPTTTYSEPAATPLPTELSPLFPLPGLNGTYYICSFPPTSNDTTSSLVPTPSAPSTTFTASLPIATDDVSSLLPSVTSSILAPTTASTITGRPKPTPTEFTVVGPSTTAVIECIPVPQLHPPAEISTSLPLPTGTSPLPSATATSAPTIIGTVV